MARKGVSCIVSSSSTAGQGRLCRRGTDESISSLDHPLLDPVDGCLSGSLHGVSLLVRERVSHRLFF